MGNRVPNLDDLIAAVVKVDTSSVMPSVKNSNLFPSLLSLLLIIRISAVFSYKGRSTLVPIVPKITARWRQMEFCIFCEKSRQNERSSVVCSLNVNKVSRIFSRFFFLCKIRLFWCNFQNAI